MTITQYDLDNYIATLRNVNQTAADKIIAYIDKHGLSNTKELLDYSYSIVATYAEAAGAWAAEMYDAIALLEGKYLPPAEIAEIAKYGDVAKAINGTLKVSENAEEIAGAATRWVKMASADTMLNNAIRDKAQFAWIPSGDSCAFCLTLASRGWQYASKKALKGGHAEHIHSNCDCQYTIRFNEHTNVEGYDPDKYLSMYRHAEGSTPQERINSMRRAANARIQTESMRRNATTVWRGEVHNNTKDDIDKLAKYAKERGIVLDSSFSSFDGDIDLVKDFLDTMNANIDEYSFMRNRKVRIKVSYSMSDNDYAQTYGTNITINGFAYRDRELLNEDYNERVKEHWFTQNSSYLDISTHESAHLIVYMNQLRVKGVTDEVFGEDPIYAIEQISQSISEYARKNDSELIAESYVSYKNGSRDNYVLSVLKYCGILK